MMSKKVPTTTTTTRRKICSMHFCYLILFVGGSSILSCCSTVQAFSVSSLLHSTTTRRGVPPIIMSSVLSSSSSMLPNRGTTRTTSLSALAMLPVHDLFLEGTTLQQVGDFLLSSSSSIPATTPAWDALSSSSIVTAIPFFPGKEVVDPVVVSNAYWDGITRQFTSLMIGNVLAILSFGIMTQIASAKIKDLGDLVSTQLFGVDAATLQKQQALKKPPPGYTGGPIVKPNYNKLVLCLMIDAIGTSSNLIPFVGEATDLVWAPIAAYTLRSLYYGSNVVFALEFAEEILLFTDVLPLATICWVVDTFYSDSQVARVLQLGVYRVEPPKQSSSSNNRRPEEMVSIERQQPPTSLNEVVSKRAVKGKWKQVGADNAEDRFNTMR